MTDEEPKCDLNDPSSHDFVDPTSDRFYLVRISAGAMGTDELTKQEVKVCFRCKVPVAV